MSTVHFSDILMVLKNTRLKSCERIYRGAVTKGTVVLPGEGYFHIRRPGGGGLAPKFASKNIGDKYHKFCPLNFRFDPKIGIFSPTFASCGNRTSQVFLLFGELGRTLPQLLPPNLM